MSVVTRIDDTRPRDSHRVGKLLLEQLTSRLDYNQRQAFKVVPVHSHTAVCCCGARGPRQCAYFGLVERTQFTNSMSLISPQSASSCKTKNSKQRQDHEPTFSCASEVPAHLHGAHHDSRRPIFHPQAERGWSSDPCGPIYFRGRYHLFYQHLRHSCQWYWGLCWDHLVSDDLIHWKNLPPAVVPTPGWYDADGCFSGTVELDPELGVPVIMYTGVYLKANEECVNRHGVPPPEHDPGTRFVERQLAVVPANPDDPDLTEWVKLPDPVIYPAPAGVNISCWRDPFCVQRPAVAGGSGDEWLILLASGIRGVGGAVLRFRSKHFTHGWQFDGLLADGDNTALGIKGQDWECPILSKLPHADTAPPLANLPDLSTVSRNSSSEVAAVGGLISAGSGSSTSSIVVELVEDGCPADAAVAAATAGQPQCVACALEPSVSQQLLLPKGKKADHMRGSSVSLFSSGLTSNASAGSLLGVGMYLVDGTISDSTALADSTICGTTAESSTICSSTTYQYQAGPLSEVDCSSSCAARQQPSESKVSVRSTAQSVDSFSTGEVCSFSQIPAERLTSTVPVLSNSSSLAVSMAICGSTSADVSLAVAADAAVEAVEAASAGAGIIVPLTEPVLAAAISAAEDAVGMAVLEEHPSTNISVWLEQTSDSAPAAVAGLQGVEVICENSSGGSGTVADAIMVITSDLAHAVCSKQQEQEQDKPLSNSSSSTTLFTDVMTASSGCMPASDSIVSSSSRSGDKSWWFCMSPDACNNPITWWLGSYDGKRFDIAAADGPHRLDLGTTLYAASLWIDPQGRQLLYGWIQEHRRVPTPPNNCSEYSYAGCICTPRVLHLIGDKLFQQPLPEIDQLRTRVSWHAQDLLLSPNGPLLPVQVVSGTHLDINVTFQPPNNAPTSTYSQASSAPYSDSFTAGAGARGCESSSETTPRAGLVFKSWKAEGKGAAVLSFDWTTHCLVCDFDEPFPDAYTPHPQDTPERRRIGGKLRYYERGMPLSLRILLDGSAVEVFTSTGETLTTRMYRGHAPKCLCKHYNSSSSSGIAAVTKQTMVTDPAAAVEVEDETGIALFAAGADVQVSRIDVWEMGSCWMGNLGLSKSLPDQIEAVLTDSNSSSIDGIGSAALIGVDAAAAVPDAGEHLTVPAGAADLARSGTLDKTLDTSAAVSEVADGRSDEGSIVSCDDNDGAMLMSTDHIPAGEQASIAGEFLKDLHIQNVLEHSA